MKALVVDDDRVLADVVAFALRREGFQVILAYDGALALRRWQEDQPDLIVLDVNLPQVDGFSVCRRIRETDEVPILLLTVRDDEEDIVKGLNLGADDYLTKPFSPRQLVARARAILRRSSQHPLTPRRRSGNFSFDRSRRELFIGESGPIHLTPLEARLMEYLMINAGQVISAETIIDNVWGPGGGDRDMLRQLVRRLRSKIEPDPAKPEYLETVPGLGYGLRS